MKPVESKPFFSDFLKDIIGEDLNYLAHKTITNTGTTTPAVNIIEHKYSFVFHIAVPGFEKDNFTIDIENDTLQILGDIKLTPKLEEGSHYSRIEFNYSKFKRAFTIPVEIIDTNNITATYTNGILEINLPKKEKEKPEKKSISIS